MHNRWQERWNDTENNRLKEIKPNIAASHLSLHSRRDEVVLHRLRIGHTYLTHGHLLKKEDAPYCFPCDYPFTIKHLLVDCVDFQHILGELYDIIQFKNYSQLFLRE